MERSGPKYLGYCSWSLESLEGFGCKDVSPIIENQMETKLKPKWRVGYILTAFS